MSRIVTTFLLCLTLQHTLAAGWLADQPLLKKRFADYSVELISIDHPETTAAWRFRIGWNDGTTVDLSLQGVGPPEAVRDVEIGSFGSNRLYVTFGGRYFIISPQTGQLIDDFETSGAEVSPDSRFIAYHSVIGYGNPDDSTIYLLYDLALSPRENRMGSVAGGSTERLSPFAAGWALYPAENRTDHSYNTALADPALLHLPRSPFVWLNSRTLSFVDSSSGMIKAVLVVLGESAHNIAVQERGVELSAVLDYSRLEPGVPPARYITVTWIDLIVDQDRRILRLTFPAADMNFKQWSLDVLF